MKKTLGLLLLLMLATNLCFADKPPCRELAIAYCAPKILTVANQCSYKAFPNCEEVSKDWASSVGESELVRLFCKAVCIATSGNLDEDAYKHNKQMASRMLYKICIDKVLEQKKDLIREGACK
jgi:hypothetical protein